MKEELVLFGTYDEIKNWYDNLGCITGGDFFKLRGGHSNIEFKPFNEQLENKEENIGKVKMICWLDPKIELNCSVNFRLTTKKVCMILNIGEYKLV